MSEVATAAEPGNTAPEAAPLTDPWGDNLSADDAALIDESPDEAPKQETDDATDDAEEVREQSTQAEAEEVTDEGKEQKDEKTVPYGALHEERQMRKEAKAEANELREKMAKMEQKFQMFQEALKPQEPEISFDEDPAEYLRKQAEKTNQTLEQLQEQQARQQQAAQQAQQQNAFLQSYQSAAKQFAEQNPDFHDAYAHLVEGRVKEHVAVGMTEQQAIDAANREEQAIVQMAFQQGINPAEKLLELAKLRGWNGSKPKSAPSVDKVDQVEKGQKAAKTISKGGASEGKLTLEALADMEGDEFDKAWKKMFPDSE